MEMNRNNERFRMSPNPRQIERGCPGWGGKVFWCGGVGRSVALGYGDASGTRDGDGEGDGDARQGISAPYCCKKQGTR
jgi:hypothetical protein